MTYRFSKLCCALALCGLSVSVFAADVPPGTPLAEKQVVVRHLKDEPATLDPAKAVGLPEIQVIRDLFEGLVNQNEKGEVIPGVAKSWQSSDNRIWTFTLRDDARWSDGTPVTAQDFVYSWQRLVNPQTTSPFAGFAALAGISNAKAITDGKMAVDKLGVSAVDAKTLRVQLDKPLPWFPNLAASFALAHGEADKRDIMQIQRGDQIVDVGGKGIVVITVPRLLRTAKAATVKGDNPVTALGEEVELAVPHITIQRPAVAEQHRFT